MENSQPSEAAWHAAAIAMQGRAISTRLSPERLEQIGASKVVVVTGWSDHVELVLEDLEVPFQAIHPEQLADVQLHPQQTVVVNCPGTGLESELAKLQAFVSAGGTLFTTDRALRHLIEPTFPGLLADSDSQTATGAVGVRVLDRTSQLLLDVLEDSEFPQWWVAPSTLPIRILNPGRVQTMLASADPLDGRSEVPLAVRFHHGRGQVIHVASHVYLQRSELRARQQEIDSLSHALREAHESEFHAPMSTESVEMPEAITIRATGANPAPTVVASSMRPGYHRPTCKWAREIRGRNRRTYSSAAEAERDGLRRCRTCRPSRPTGGR